MRLYYRFLFMKKIKALFIFLILAAHAVAQTPATYTSADILSRMQKLKVLGSVLYVAAHPDDENTRLLAWLSKDRQYRTGYLSITRGDGGQNLIGEEQGVALGLIRTQELLAARRIDGAEQFFTRAYDFGFSKSTEEAFQIWNKEKILGDVVWVIRNFKPDVIITRFPEDSRAGHGHHSGSGVLAREAFIAAADPTRFPAQLKNGIQPWKAKRILWNTFNFGNNNTISSDQFKVDVGTYNPLLGKGYGEISAESRSQHKSQGFGVPASRGSSFEYFLLTGGDPVKDSLMDGVDVSWTRIGAAGVSQRINEVISRYNFSNPSLSVKPLVELYREIATLPDQPWKSKKLEEVQELISACAGLYFEASTPQSYSVQGDSLRVNFSVINRSGAFIKWNKVTFESYDTTIAQALAPNRSAGFNKQFYVDQSKGISQPYWLTQPMEKGSYNVEDQALIGKPENDPAFVASFAVSVEGLDLVYQKGVMYKHTDPVKGELFQPLSVVPPLSVNTSPAIMLFRKNQPMSKNYTIAAAAYANISPAKATIHNRTGKSEDDVKDVDFAIAKGMTKNFPMPYTNKDMGKTDQDVITSRIEYKNSQFDQANYLALATINYDHIPPIKYFYVDGVTVLNLDIKTAGKKAGYIRGAGDKVPEALEQLGYEVSYIGEADMDEQGLSKYDVIVVGLRAYNIHEWLGVAYNALMNYVKAGGVMVVQYNTNNFAGPFRAGKIGPYDFTISSGRVTNEESPIQFNMPSSPLLNWPNKITDLDFNGWIQERGIYFADKWAPEYQAVLGMRDPGEAEDRKGSLLMAQYGKGKFVYTGLALFRQLPAGVGGAYRLFANIIANPNYKK
jgi:LmbE family N-acetylglucosaminyl deacetylase